VKPALLCLALLAGAAPAAAQNCGGNGVSLQVLGSAGPELVARRAASSHLLWLDGKARLLIDAGSGTALRFAESGAQLRDLDALLLTSLEADHSSGLVALVQAAAFDTRTRNLPIFGPPGNRLMPSTVTFVRDLFDGTRGAWRHLGDYLAPLTRSPYKLEARDVRPAPPRLGTPRAKSALPLLPVFANDRLRIQAVPTRLDSMPALTLRIDAGGKSVVFAGEAQPDDPAITALAADADLLVVHHALADGAAGGAGSPAAIGRLARAARSKQLVLVHRTPATLGREDETSGVLRKYYTGPVAFADDLACFRP
jgi:ribonuclease BN (tRNA processing enzyme)